MDSCILESMVAYLIACAFHEILCLSYFRDCTIEECKYKLCGIIVAPMMPSAI